MTSEEIRAAHDTLLPAVREAAAAVMQFYHSQSYEVQHKDADNPVTEADFAANRILSMAIRKFFPGDAVLSEETDAAGEREQMNRDRAQARRVWILDPIDGTREFIKGRDEFAISVGLVIDGAPVLGFICNPAKKYLLSGGAGIGLFRDGEPLVAALRTAIHPPELLPRIVVSRSEYKSGKLKHLEGLYGDLMQRAVGSIAYKLALVADGTYDLVISVKPKNEWDIAGGAALIVAAGLEIAEGSGAPVVFNKPDTESFGLVCGTHEACAWYRKIATQT